MMIMMEGGLIFYDLVCGMVCNCQALLVILFPTKLMYYNTIAL